MRTPIIDRLDLRPAKPDEEFVWDWPQFPPRVAALIGIDARIITAIIDRQGLRVAKLYDELWSAMVFGETIQGGALLWRRRHWWHRFIMWAAGWH